jgi:protein involved in polysaccharide export with SLBB domain
MTTIRLLRCGGGAVAVCVRHGMLAVVTLALSHFVSNPASAQSPTVTQAASAQGFASSVLRPGDVLRLRIWREPDLSGEFPVDERGMVTFPKLGLIRVTDEPFDALKARIISSYATYITQPVEVTALFRVRVLGAVRTPGIYRVEPAMTLSDAIALAGGVTSAAKTDQVRLIRDGQALNAPLSPSAVLAETPLRSGDQLFVPQRSWVSRNPGILMGAVSTAATLIWAVRRQY